MTSFRSLLEFNRLISTTLRQSLLALPVAIVTGSACALFLWSLDVVTGLFQRYPSLLYGLPLAGVVVVRIYQRWGQSIVGGNSLIIEQIHEPTTGVPTRMAPIILVTTLLTHLCGGSAGREGTAVQMGGSIASALAGFYRRQSTVFAQRYETELRWMLMAGIAAGFGGVFGTPVAGAVFALEVLVAGRFQHDAFVPCLVAAVISDKTCTAWGISHTHYSVASPSPELTNWGTAILWGQVCLLSVASGGISQGFARAVHQLQSQFARWIRWPLLRPVFGGSILILITLALGTRDYLGLGVTSGPSQQVTIVSCFQSGGATSSSWFWKMLFTVVTLSTGFKGGEVTPLFFIGAALGNAIAMWCGAPVDLFAAIGFVAVFAGATKTPLASTLMAIELFGAEHAVFYAFGCSASFLVSGDPSIYSAQRRLSQEHSGHGVGKAPT